MLGPDPRPPSPWGCDLDHSGSRDTDPSHGHGSSPARRATTPTRTRSGWHCPPSLAASPSVQRRSWGDTVDDATNEPPAGRASTWTPWPTTWHAAITRPPEARWRVLVAVAEGRVVRLATTLPSQDPDADTAADGAIDELVVDPTARRRGHGSRLVNACVDTLRADGFLRARHWLRADDDELRRAFLTEAGWAPDGAHREIGADDDCRSG